MNDLAIPLSGVDALHAHFAEWVKFLDAKGLELEALLAKLEARRARAAADPQVEARGSGYLELAFGPQAMASAPDSSPASAGMEPEFPAEDKRPEEMTCAEVGGREPEEPLQIENRASGETPNPTNSEGRAISTDGYWENP